MLAEIVIGNMEAIFNCSGDDKLIYVHYINIRTNKEFTLNFNDQSAANKYMFEFIRSHFKETTNVFARTQIGKTCRDISHLVWKN